jgi:hypothetical protein
MTEILLKLLVDQAVALKRGSVQFFCAQQEGCERNLKLIGEMAREAKCSVYLSPIGAGIHINWLHVVFCTPKEAGIFRNTPDGGVLWNN